MDNISANGSFGDQHTSTNVHSPWISAAQVLRCVCIPVIAGVGLVGNTLSLMVFLSKRMKKSPCSVFQASLAVVDNTFLVCLLITWIDGERTLLTVNATCQLLIFITYVASFLSVWLIVGFTCERFVAICFPLRCSYMCNSFRQKVIVAVLTVTASLLYKFTFWTFEMQQWNRSLKCLPKPEHYRFLNIVVWIDSFLTMFFPFVLITVLNVLIVRSLISCRERQESFSLRPLTENNTMTSSNGRKCRMGRYENRFSQKSYSTEPYRNGVRHRTQVRVTKRLLAVSSMFLLLNLPSHIIRLHNLIISVTSNHINVTPRFFFLQELTLVWYYITFCGNFFVYMLTGNNFKQTLFHILHCRKRKDSFRAEMLSKLRSTQRSHTTL